MLGSSKTELKLLACQNNNKNNNKSWNSVAGDQKIALDETYDFGEGTLAIANLSKDWQIQGTLEPASRYLVKILQDTELLLDKLKQQEEEIEQWKQSLHYQLQELNNREEELEKRLEYIDQRAEELVAFDLYDNPNENTYFPARDNEAAREEAKKTLASRQPLGKILQQADLVTANQIDVALEHQSEYPDLRIGEILALRGWIKLETADFFAEHWSNLLQQQPKQPLGYYLQKATLLDEEQISELLSEQTKIEKRMGVNLRLGAIAVLKDGSNNPRSIIFSNIYSPNINQNQP
ncbi:MAG: hypothetical protein HC784_14705 [Hydrococcus sp. CSU_1_8]|nr:hypothetical protein [Hydrococcus sp. CSU_1_8]